MSTTNTANTLAELNRSLDGLRSGSVIPLAAGVATAPILNRPRRGRPPGSKNRTEPENKEVQRSRGRPPASPLDQRVSNPEFAADIKALREKYGFRSTKDLLMRAREATHTRMRFEMTPARWARMKELFGKNKKPREVAAIMGCSQPHANWVRRQLKLNPHRAAA